MHHRLTSPSSSSFVSTDNTLSAFIWQAVARARLPRLDDDPSIQSTLMRAIDVHAFLGISQFYLGPIQSNVYITVSLSSLIEEPLGDMAMRLRSALNDKPYLKYHTRTIATFLSCTWDKIIFSFGAALDLSTDIILSSWLKVKSHSVDFNLGLGFPEAVRKPRCNEVEGLIFLLPKTLQGDVPVALCLQDEDLERLRTDTDFMKCAEYIG